MIHSAIWNPQYFLDVKENDQFSIDSITYHRCKISVPTTTLICHGTWELQNSRGIRNTNVSPNLRQKPDLVLICKKKNLWYIKYLYILTKYEVKIKVRQIPGSCQRAEKSQRHGKKSEATEVSTKTYGYPHHSILKIIKNDQKNPRNQKWQTSSQIFFSKS